MSTDIGHRTEPPVWRIVVRFALLGAVVPLTVAWVLGSGMSWFSAATTCTVVASLLIGDRRLFRAAVARDGEAIVCRFAPRYEGDVYRLFVLFGVIGLWASVIAFTKRGEAAMLSAVGFPLLAGIPLLIFAILRMRRGALLRITPRALYVRSPSRGSAVTEIGRDTVRSVTPELVPRSNGASNWRVAVEYLPPGSGETKTLPIGSVQYDCPLWISAGRLDLLDALTLWKDDPGADPRALMDRVEAILLRRSRPETRPPYVPAPPAPPEPAEPDPDPEPEPEPAAAYEYPALDQVVNPPGSRRRWHWVPVGLVAVTLAVGVVLEERAATALEPPPGDRFGNGQTWSTTFAAGETRVVYGQLTSQGRRGPRTAECQVSTRPLGLEVRQGPVGKSRVLNWTAVSTVTATQAGIVEVTCQGYAGSKFGVGAPIPPRRLLNGVADYSGTSIGVMLVTLVFLLAIVVGVVASRIDAGRKKWVTRFWAPLVLVVATALSSNSVWDGVKIGIAWSLAAWFFGRMFRERR